jgi:hypothetical protein
MENAYIFGYIIGITLTFLFGYFAGKVIEWQKYYDSETCKCKHCKSHREESIPRCEKCGQIIDEKKEE